MEERRTQDMKLKTQILLIILQTRARLANSLEMQKKPNLTDNTTRNAVKKQKEGTRFHASAA